MQCFKQQQFITDPQDSSLNLTQNFTIFENSNIPNCVDAIATPIYQLQHQSPVQQLNNNNSSNNNNCDNYNHLSSPNLPNNSSASPAATSNFSSISNAQMPHFGLGAGPGMANNAYAQSPPSPPLHHSVGGGGGNGGLMPPSPPNHHQQGHNQHQQQQQHHPHLAMLPRGLSGGNPGGGGGGSIMSTGLNTSVNSLSSSATSYRTHIEEKKLTRDAMERYMRERNDMVIVILHAKVSFLVST